MLIDVEQRQSALDLKSKLVKAPAGSGKTALLTNYYLKALSVVEHPFQICAITFTRKACREMAGRISDSLNRVADGFIPSNEFERENYKLAKAALANSERRGWNLEGNNNLLHISTIDAFCQSVLVNQIGEESMLTNTKVANDPAGIYEFAVKETLDLYSHPEHGRAIQNLMAHFGNNINRVQNLLVEMLASRDRWIPTIFSGRRDTRQQLELKRKEFVQTVLDDDFAILKRYELDIQFLVEQLDIENSELSCLVRNGFKKLLVDNKAAILALCDLFLTRTGSAKKRFGKNEGIPASVKGGARVELVDRLKTIAVCIHAPLCKFRSLPDYRFKETEWGLLDAAFEVMPLTLANLKIAFDVFGEVDFIEIAMSATTALNSDDDNCVTNRAMNTGQQLRHLLVDEFQDVNDIQVSMLKHILEQWEDTDGKSLFLVGDAMQSLYGFRGSNVNIMMRVEDEGIGNQSMQTLELKTNFRSSVGVVDWINRVFKEAFPQSNNLVEGACPYRESVALHNDDDLNPVEIHGFASDPDGVNEARYIVDIIENVQQDDPTKSIAVLGRTRSSLSNIINELNIRNTIQRQDIDLHKVSKEPIAILAIALARIFIDDMDKIAWVTLLNSGLCGLSLETIEQVFAGQKDPYEALLRDELKNKLKLEEWSRFSYFIDAVNDSFDLKHRKDTSAILRGLWLKLHGGSLAKSIRCQSNVDLVFDIFKYQDLNLLSLAWLERKLDKLYSKQGEIREDGIIPVKIMTIHQSKGLEFDVVIIPSMHRRGGTSKGNLVQWSDSGDCSQVSALACSEEIGVKSDDAYHKFLAKLQRQREYQELVRLVYVATTRAIKKVYMTGSVKLKGCQVCSPVKGSMFSVISHAMQNELVLHERTHESRQADVLPVLNVINVDGNDYLPERHTLAAYRGRNHEKVLHGGFRWERPVLRKETIVLQRVVEQINRDGIELWDEQRINEYGAVILSHLKEQSIEQEYLISAVIRIKSKLKSLLQSRTFQRIATTHVKDDVGLDLAMNINRKTHFLHIDRAFIDSDNRVHVIDWGDFDFSHFDRENSLNYGEQQPIREIITLNRQAYSELHQAQLAAGGLDLKYG